MKRRSLSAFLLALCLLFSSLPLVSAKSSAELEAELAQLEEEAEQIAAEMEALESEKAQTSENLTLYAQEKLKIDREAELLRRTVENTSAQVTEMSALIAARQEELDLLELDYDALLERYQLRIRAMQQHGEITLWDVLFSAGSFTDMLSYSVMVQQIARADQRMLEELRDSAQQLLSAKEALAGQKARLEETRLTLKEQEAQLAAKRAQADEMIAALNADRERLIAEIIATAELEAVLSEQIAQKEKEYTAALLVENGGISGFYTESGFIFPVDVSGFAYLSSPYGMRDHPISGTYTMHNGVDLASYLYTPIYASKSGKVTTAELGGGWGNYVVINHGDGFSTLYAHMIQYVVSSGEYVEQGEVIGYVGSTGNSNGPHLHFTIYYDGATVNPMDYIRLP